MYVFYPNLKALADKIRDGKTPQNKVEQILAIAPILPGQETTMPSTPARPIAQGNGASSNIRPQQANNDLIDFGDELKTPKAVPSHHPQQSQQPEQFASLNELQEPKLRRQDTDTQSVDEFVDAQQ